MRKSVSVTLGSSGTDNVTTVYVSWYVSSPPVQFPNDTNNYLSRVIPLVGKAIGGDLAMDRRCLFRLVVEKVKDGFELVNLVGLHNGLAQIEMHS
jgi:hypothetical protein